MTFLLHVKYRWTNQKRCARSNLQLKEEKDYLRLSTDLLLNTLCSYSIPSPRKQLPNVALAVLQTPTEPGTNHRSRAWPPRWFEEDCSRCYNQSHPVQTYRPPRPDSPHLPLENFGSKVLWHPSVHQTAPADWSHPQKARGPRATRTARAGSWSCWVSADQIGTAKGLGPRERSHCHRKVYSFHPRAPMHLVSVIRRPERDDKVLGRDLLNMNSRVLQVPRKATLHSPKLSQIDNSQAYFFAWPFWPNPTTLISWAALCASNICSIGNVCGSWAVWNTSDNTSIIQ